MMSGIVDASGNIVKVQATSEAADGKPYRFSFSPKGWAVIVMLAIGGPGGTLLVTRAEVAAIKDNVGALQAQTGVMERRMTDDREEAKQRMTKLEAIVQAQQSQLGEFVSVVRSVARVEQSVEDIKRQIYDRNNSNR